MTELGFVGTLCCRKCIFRVIGLIWRNSNFIRSLTHMLTHAMYSKQALPIYILPVMSTLMPSAFLDGEIW